MRIFRIGIVVACILAAGVCLNASVSYAAITVNGYLGDWGVTPGSDWAPDNGAVYVVEDQGGGIGAFLNPGYGGQLFDAEAMYYLRADGNINVAIVTGHPVGGTHGHYPGDIFFDFGSGMQYGLETTGTNAGHLYKNPLWNTGLSNWGGVSDPTTMQAGSWEDRGLADFVYLNTYPGTGDANHWVMEMAIPESFFNYDFINGGTVHWTQTCGNDAIDLKVAHTPEPVTMALFGFGLLGFGIYRKEKR